MNKQKLKLSISSVISRLMMEQTKINNADFTASQLAEAINVPRSVITRLLNKDPKKCVCNPRIETLIKIIDYFITQGIDTSLDELVGLYNE